MNIMRRFFILAVAVISAIALGSCDKEDGGTSGDLVGTWRITKHEYKFDGKTVGVEIPIEDYDTGTCTFENGGKCSIGGVPIKYSYSASSHTLELTMVIKTSYDVLKLTLSEMVWSDILYPPVKTTNRDKKADVYNGYAVFECNDGNLNSSSYYYKKGGNLIPCEEIVSSIWSIFSGDEDGYYDEMLTYFEKVE